MIFTSSSVTSFQNYRLREKSIQNASLAADVCSVRMLTFPLRMSPHSPTEAKGRDLEQEKKLPTNNWGGGVDIVVDVYKLLVLAGRMHDCLVQDANL